MRNRNFLFLLFFSGLLLYSHPISASDNILRTNLLGAIAGFRGIEYEKLISSRNAISIDYWSVSSTDSEETDNSTISNLRILWREYEKENQTGLFYAIGASSFSILYPDFVLLDKKTVAFGLDFKLGLQGRISDTFVASTTFGFTYFLSSPKKTASSDGRTETIDISGFLPNIGVNFGYNF